MLLFELFKLLIIKVAYPMDFLRSLCKSRLENRFLVNLEGLRILVWFKQL
jgi:hypothetical protein